MLVNADFDHPVVLRPEDREWVRSPAAGVERQMLDRVGDEVARATSIVRYIPGSTFGAHDHALGEEFLVLEGSFADEHGVYPTGTYVRNPPGTAHRPDVPDGCVIFVKLRQFDPADLTPVVADLNDEAIDVAMEPGLRGRIIHRHGAEVVSALRIAPGARLRRDLPGGAEIFLLRGSVAMPSNNSSTGTLTTNTWARLPPEGRLDLSALSDGAHLWMKEGHLPPS